MADVNAPQTVWRPANGNGAPTTTAVAMIVDTLGAFLVDTTGAFVVDTGTDFKLHPLTAWSQNDGV